MSEFYGSLQGSRGEATRCGTKSSGIRASAQSWEGSVTVSILKGDDGENWVCIQARTGSGVGGSTLYYGPLADLISAVQLEPMSARGLKLLAQAERKVKP